MPKKHDFEALGTHMALSIWDDISAGRFAAIASEAVDFVTRFDMLYSRFRPDSLITELSKKTGIVEVPTDLVAMLQLYAQIHTATKGKINPCIGNALSDAGYDANYSFIEKQIRPTPLLPDALTILDATHIALHQNVLLDLGALGKGYVIDLVYEYVRSQGIQQFLVDGSGDIRYSSEGESIVCGLEHPLDPTLVIGTLSITGGSLCASAINRRAWGQGRNHYIDPDTGESPTEIIATWVHAESAALADALASALFFSPPEALAEFTFEYLILSKSLKSKSSAGFTAELFTT
jgi:FAD:protein FMN transferase